MSVSEQPARAHADPGSGLRGEVVYLYAFDVASEIRFGEVAELFARKPLPYTVRPDPAAPRSVPLSRPLAVKPPPPAAQLFGSPVRLLVRMYEVGVVSVTVRAAINVDSLSALLPFHNPVLDDGRPLDALARQVCAEVCRELGSAMVRPGPMPDPEAYTVFTLTDLGGEHDASQWLTDHQRQAAELLTDTPAEKLSEAQVHEALRLRRSFEITDLTIIDWDAALIVDLAGSPEDVLFVLELANSQLEEFRWMDQSLDHHLDRAYAALERPHWPMGLGAGPVLRSLRRLRVDLARLADEVGHATKFIGEWHLARVYLLARKRFHLDQWRGSVEQRLRQLDDLYTLAQSELHDRRMLVLELAVVVLFVIDIAAIFLGRR